MGTTENKIMNWIKHPIELIGHQVKLIPMEEAHYEALFSIAKDKSIWKYSPSDCDGSDPELLRKSLDDKLIKRDSGDAYTFTIVLKEENKIIGSTMFHTINEQHKNIEIGATWFHPDYWSTGLNTECKYLMLQFCFEVLGTMRVQIKSLDTNIRSRKAIEKIGAKFEGILRKDKILWDGAIRNAAYYSIVDDEWPMVKQNLQQRLKA